MLTGTHALLLGPGKTFGDKFAEIVRNLESFPPSVHDDRAPKTTRSPGHNRSIGDGLNLRDDGVLAIVIDVCLGIVDRST